MRKMPYLSRQSFIKTDLQILLNTINYMCYFYISHAHNTHKKHNVHLQQVFFLKKPNTKLWLPDSIVYFSKATSMYPSEQSWKMLVWKMFWGMGSIPSDRKLSKWLLNVSIDHLIGYFYRMIIIFNANLIMTKQDMVEGKATLPYSDCNSLSITQNKPIPNM